TPPPTTPNPLKPPPTSTPNPPQPKQLNHSQRTQILLYFGLAGFLFGVFLLFNPKFKYHDIAFHPKAIVDTLLARKERQLFPNRPSPDSILLAKILLRKISRTDDDDSPLPDFHERIAYPLPPDSVRQRLIAYVLYTRLQAERRRIEDLTDTSFNSRFFVGSLFTTNKSALERLYYNDDTSIASRTFHFRYDRDTTAAEYSIRAEGDITLHEVIYPNSGFTFFNKYPNFGTLALLMIFQFMAFFIVIPLSVVTMRELMGIESTPKRSNIYKAIGIATGVMVLFAATAGIFIFTPTYAGNRLFMYGFATIQNVYYIFAYLASITCYAGYLFTGRIIGDTMVGFQDLAVRHRRMLVENAAIDNQTKLDAITLADDYKKLRRLWTVFFYTSAFLLSMNVLQSGSLFSAIDSLDLVSFLNAPPAHIVLRNDFVYLIGGFYSILLLIFYIPVKISMLNMESQIPDTPGTGSDNTSWLPVFSSGLRTTASILAASSPFLISIIQFILQSLGGSKS
ncbi:MAG TPA: hypothetical protein VG101_09180, partial [Puia sp.]|nr:hypothetical protein [Puia sp.]